MAVPDSYLHSVKNVSAIFAAVKDAGVPDRFSHEFLKQLGFTSSGDRAVIAVMKALRFVDDNSTPTDRYRHFRDPSLSGAVMAQALRDAYSDLFTINQKAHEMGSAGLLGAFKRITGKGDAVAQKMASTFKALAGLGDWTASTVKPSVEPEGERPEGPGESSAPTTTPDLAGGFPALHHNVHVHLPVRTDVKVYDAIFRSLREHLG